MNEIKPERKALVLGTDFKNYRSCLTIIRSLGRKGIRVHLGWSHHEGIARHSKYVKYIHELPAYTTDNNYWKDELIALIEKGKFDFVVPVNEQASTPLELHRADFEKYPSVYLLNQKAYDVVFDKFKTDDLAHSLNIPMPKERRVRDLAEIDSILGDFAFPIVLKPRASFDKRDLKRKMYVYKAYNAKELKTSLRHLLAFGDVLIQENFIGSGVGIEFLADQGKILFAFEHVRLHEPLMGGGSSYRKSAELNPDLLDATKKIISQIDYTGVGMAEFKFDFSSGKWIFLEINGRFWGSIPLAVAAGADFPYFLYQMKVENKRDFAQDYNTDLYCRNRIRDFEWILSNFSTDKTDPSKNTLPNSKVLSEFSNLLLFREKNDTCVIDDMMPGIYEFGRLIKLIAKKIREALPQCKIIRNFRVHRARKLMRKAKGVLFICYGNIYRSPFADNYARNVLPADIEIASGGYLPRAGRPCHQRAIDIADEFDVDLSAHRSVFVTEKMIRRADVIFIFDRHNKDSILERFPFAKRKLCYLGHLSKRGPVIINDPIENNLYGVREIYRTIKQAIDEYVDRIKK